MRRDGLCAQHACKTASLPHISPKRLWEPLSILPASSLPQSELVNPFWEAGSGVSEGPVMGLGVWGHAFIWNLGGKNGEVEACSSLWLAGISENSHFPLEGKIPGKVKLWLSPLFLWAGAATEPFPDIFIFEVPDRFSSTPL